MVQEPPPLEIPEAQIFLESVPEKILIKGKEYSLTIKILNITDKRIDYYLKYRINGFKILNVSDPAGSGQKASLDPLNSVSFNMTFTPEIEGPLQLEIALRGWKKAYHPVERECQVEYEVEVEYPVEFEVEVGPRMEKQIRTRMDKKREKRVRKEIRTEYEIDFEEIALHQTSGYMEAVISGIDELDTFITQGDVSTEIVTDIGAMSNSIIFHFPNKQMKHDLKLLRQINKKMFQDNGKNFLYLNYAISSEFNAKEQKIIKQGIDKFLPKLDQSKKLLIFNLDFLPKMLRPTIVLGASPRSNALREKFISIFNSNVEVHIDNDVFVGGNLHEILTTFTQQYNPDIINLALSAEFQEQPELFIKFIDPFVE